MYTTSLYATICIVKKKMSLSHAIATILIKTPRTGYELSKEFNEKVSYYWQATSQQIYRELARMEAQGLVAVEVIPQQGRPDKKVYSITEKGRKELIEWIAQPSESSATREELLVKIKAGFLVPPRVLINEIERHRQAHQAKLATYHALERQIPDREYLDREEIYLYLTLRCGIAYESMWLSWCEETLKTLRTLEEEDKKK